MTGITQKNKNNTTKNTRHTAQIDKTLSLVLDPYVTSHLTSSYLTSSYLNLTYLTLPYLTHPTSPSLHPLSVVAESDICRNQHLI